MKKSLRPTLQSYFAYYRVPEPILALAIFGVLGSGIGLGLGIAMAFMTAHISANWREAIVTFAAVAVLGGCFNGMKAWSQLFRTEVPFPPIYPPI
jgi:hypothetical protein